MNIFSEYVLKNCKNIDNLLNNPNFIFTLDINFDKEMFLVHFSYIISLIHNNYNSFIITYLVSFLMMDYYKIIYMNNKRIIKLLFFKTLYDKIENDVRSILLNVDHETFKKYYEYKPYGVINNDFINKNYIGAIISY